MQDALRRRVLHLLDRAARAHGVEPLADEPSAAVQAAPAPRSQSTGRLKHQSSSKLTRPTASAAGLISSGDKPGAALIEAKVSTSTGVEHKAVLPHGNEGAVWDIDRVLNAWGSKGG